LITQRARHALVAQTHNALLLQLLGDVLSFYMVTRRLQCGSLLLLLLLLLLQLSD
jgi:hypothetical protein